MSETAVYEPPVPLGDTFCACAAVAARTNPADRTHPVNSFITHRSCHAQTPRAVSLFCPRRNFIAKSGGPWAGSRHVCFKTGAGRSAPDAGQPATFTRLYDREKFGMVTVRTVVLSQLRLRTRHRDCSAKLASTPKRQKGTAVR